MSQRWSHPIVSYSTIYVLSHIDWLEFGHPDAVLFFLHDSNLIKMFQCCSEQHQLRSLRNPGTLMMPREHQSLNGKLFSVILSSPWETPTHMLTAPLSQCQLGALEKTNRCELLIGSFLCLFHFSATSLLIFDSSHLWMGPSEVSSPQFTTCTRYGYTVKYPCRSHLVSNNSSGSVVYPSVCCQLFRTTLPQSPQKASGCQILWHWSVPASFLYPNTLWEMTRCTPETLSRGKWMVHSPLDLLTGQIMLFCSICTVLRQREMVGGSLGNRVGERVLRPGPVCVKPPRNAPKNGPKLWLKSQKVLRREFVLCKVFELYLKRLKRTFGKVSAWFLSADWDCSELSWIQDYNDVENKTPALNNWISQ